MRSISVIEHSIKDALEEARPYLQKDGGDVEFIRFEEETGVVEISMTGACRTCPLAIMTLRAGIERIVLEKVPEVKRIENVYPN
jgi:Fe-S cluster biogenesis protein NfuA